MMPYCCNHKMAAIYRYMQDGKMYQIFSCVWCGHKETREMEEL